MNIMYPAVFHHENNAYWVEFPDLEGCQSSGDTLAEALDGAKEALSVYCAVLLESGRALPTASDMAAVPVPADACCCLVRV